MSPVDTWRSTAIALSTSVLISAGVTLRSCSKYLEFLATYSDMMAVNWSGSGSFGNVGVLNCFTSVQYLCSEAVSAPDEFPFPPLLQAVRTMRSATASTFTRITTTVPPRSGEVRPPDPVGPGLAHRAFGWARPYVVPSSDGGVACPSAELPAARREPGQRRGVHRPAAGGRLRLLPRARRPGRRRLRLLPAGRLRRGRRLLGLRLGHGTGPQPGRPTPARG